jgi:hypothetical protein
MTRSTTALFLVALAAFHVDEAHAISVLTRQKVLALHGEGDPNDWRGVLRVGRDTALAEAPSPECPAVSTFELGLFTVATNGVERNARVTLECARWRAVKRGWVYDDPALPGGVRKIVYGSRGLVVKLAGPQVLPAPGPVGYALAWFEVGDTRFHLRFHEFRKNEAASIVSRTPSRRAADAEAAFWAHLWGDDPSEAHEEAARAALGEAVRRSKRDGRSRFLLGMLHLYRFGRLTTRIVDAGPEARAEIAAAVAALDEADALLWDRDTRLGDSRVPGFAAAARYALAVVDGDAGLLEQARNDLAYALEINAFFNVFDLMTVVQAEPPGSPAFLEAFNAMDAYLADPDTLLCALTQPEVCGNAGLAPTALQGTFVLFGDFYAKGGDADAARQWYQLGAGLESNWRFSGMYANRLATVEARVAAYQDGDPANDPPIVGSGAEACASCHNRAVAAPAN